MNFENVCSDFCQGHGPFMDFVLEIVQKEFSVCVRIRAFNFLVGY